MSKRFITYVISRMFKSKLSCQTAIFDTQSLTSTYASDLFFKPEELKHW